MSLEKTLTSIKDQKLKNKTFYKTSIFNEKWNELRKTQSSQIIIDTNYINCIESLLENYRNNIFFIPSYKYSLLYDGLIIEKFFLEERVYVIHPIDNYIKATNE